MTNKTTMLEPVGYFACNPESLKPEWGEDCVCQDDVYDPEETGTIGRPFVFVDQAEAYADARVREALEEAAKTVMDAPITAGMLDDGGAKALAIHANSRIRALIQQENKS